MIYRVRGVALLALLSAALIASAGCRTAGSRTSEQQPVSARPVATIAVMSPDQKRSLIASSFWLRRPRLSATW